MGSENCGFEIRGKIILIYRIKGEFSLRAAKISSITILGGIKN